MRRRHRAGVLPAALVVRPFTVQQALAHGMTLDELRGPAVRRVRRGVYVAADVPESPQLHAAAVTVRLPPQAAFSHVTAAVLLGLPVADGSGRLHVSVPPGVRVGPRAGLFLHSGLDPADVVLAPGPDLRHAPDPVPGSVSGAVAGLVPGGLRHGLRVTCPARTWLDLAGRLAPEELVVVGDAAWRHWARFADEVDVRLAASAGRRGVRAARAARARLRPGVDSPQETRLRLVLADAGLPEPEVNVDVRDVTGAWLARPDLSWPRQRVAVEYEGDHHRTNQAQWRRDVGRDAALQAAGWTVLRVTAADLRQPGRLVARVREALAGR